MIVSLPLKFHKVKEIKAPLGFCCLIVKKGNLIFPQYSVIFNKSKKHVDVCSVT